MYGLEVCKSLGLPADFLELANNIRIKYHSPSNSILSLGTSHFNTEKIVGICEMCQKLMGTEVHHLQHQKMANENNFIVDENLFHKNHAANLVTLCNVCHLEFHKTDEMHKKVKTTDKVVVKTIKKKSKENK